MNDVKLPDSVHIQTGSRLHFGPLSYLPKTGRHFGGLGLMIDTPGVSLTATKSTFEGTVQGSVRAEKFLRTLIENSAQDSLSRPIDLHVEHEIPSHQGLGSGTQLGVAVAEAIVQMNQTDALSTRELAERVGRGNRSAIGIYGYEQGGFLIEAGQRAQHEIGELSVRLPFPEEWTMELISLRSEAGMHGDQESQAFGQLTSMPESLSGRLSHIALTEILPAIQSQHAEDWCAAIDTYGQLVGEFFSPIQGGVYAIETIRQLVTHLRKHGVKGIAQSSWGPTIAVFCPLEQRSSLHDLLAEFPAAAELTRQTATPLNEPRQLIISR